MSNVTLRIGGRTYAVACGEGQEQHIGDLGRTIDEKLSTLEGRAGLGEARTLLFAALLLADEVHELRQAPAADPLAPAELPLSSQPEFAGQLEALADRLEGLADRL